MSSPRYLFALLAAATPACATGDEEVSADDLKDALCSSLDCSGGKADAIASLVDAYFNHGGDLAAAGGSPVARYRARIRSSQTVRDGDGEELSGLSGLAHCGFDPADCTVALETKTYVTNGVSVAGVLDALYGDWRIWWRHSQLAGELSVRSASALGPDGVAYAGTHFVFEPLGTSIGSLSLVDIDLTLDPPRPIADGYVVPIHMNGPSFTCATPTACMTLTVIDQGDRVALVERWDGMKVTGALKRFPAVAGVLHRWAGESNPILRPTLAFDPLGGETGWVGLADFLEAKSHPELGSIPFADQIHDTVSDELRVRTDSGGRYIEGGTTVDRIDAPPSRVVAALFGDWGCWWHHSQVDNVVAIVDANGAKISQSYDLTPLSIPLLPPLTRVHEVMRAPYLVTNTGWTEGRVWRIDIDLQGWPGSGGGNSFAGPAHFEVQERRDGATRLVARFDHVRPLGVFSLGQSLATLATKLHAMAEQGTMPPPARGTGLPGLVQFVALGQPLRNDAFCTSILR